MSTSFTARAIASTCLALRSMSSYFIRKLSSGSTAPVLGTRSRTWPYEARISKSLPRYFFSVFALEGDSTMSRCDAIFSGSLHALEARAGDGLYGALDLEPCEPGGECSSLEAGALRELVDRERRRGQRGEECVGMIGAETARAGIGAGARDAELRQDIVRAFHELRSLL